MKDAIRMVTGNGKITISGIFHSGDSVVGNIPVLEFDKSSHFFYYKMIKLWRSAVIVDMFCLMNELNYEDDAKTVAKMNEKM